MGEYMIKNFEAMACGCVLLAYSQGDRENQALGFIDMHNLVLYRDIDELRFKLCLLREQPELARGIARAGCELVAERYSFSSLGKLVVEAMRPPLRERPPLSRIEMVRARWSWLP